MGKTVAITHADLAPSRRTTELGSKTGVVLMILTILCGLFCFILCLIAEATRSQERWVGSADNGKEEVKYECAYSGSGKTPLLCAAVAFVGLAVGMVVQHMYLLIAISRSPPPALVSWDPHSSLAKTLTWQAGFFFVATWLCFAVGEILLLIGLSVESGHLKNRSKPRTSCLTIRQGLFCAAGVFSLATVFLAAGLNSITCTENVPTSAKCAATGARNIRPIRLPACLAPTADHHRGQGRPGGQRLPQPT